MSTETNTHTPNTNRPNAPRPESDRRATPDVKTTGNRGQQQRHERVRATIAGSLAETRKRIEKAPDGAKERLSTEIAWLSGLEDRKVLIEVVVASESASAIEDERRRLREDFADAIAAQHAFRDADDALKRVREDVSKDTTIAKATAARDEALAKSVRSVREAAENPGNADLTATKAAALATVAEAAKALNAAKAKVGGAVKKAEEKRQKTLAGLKEHSRELDFYYELLNFLPRPERRGPPRGQQRPATSSGDARVADAQAKQAGNGQRRRDRGKRGGEQRGGPRSGGRPKDGEQAARAKVEVEKHDAQIMSVISRFGLHSTGEAERLFQIAIEMRLGDDLDAAYQQFIQERRAPATRITAPGTWSLASLPALRGLAVAAKKGESAFAVREAKAELDAELAKGKPVAQG